MSALPIESTPSPWRLSSVAERKDPARAARFRAARKAAGLTQFQAAAKAGVSMSTVTRADAGLALDVDSMTKIAQVYGTTLDRLAGIAPVTRVEREDARGPAVLEELIVERGVDADVAARARTMSLHSGMATRLEAGAVLDAAASILARERSGGAPPPNDPRAVIDTASGQRARTRAPRRT